MAVKYHNYPRYILYLQLPDSVRSCHHLATSKYCFAIGLLIEEFFLVKYYGEFRSTDRLYNPEIISHWFDPYPYMGYEVEPEECLG